MDDRLKAGNELLRRAEMALRTRNPEAAQRRFGRAAAVFGGPDLHLGLAQSHRGLAAAAVALGDHDAARSELDRAIEGFRFVRTLLVGLEEEQAAPYQRLALEGEGSCEVTWANLALQQGHSERAHEHVNRAYPLFREVGSSPAMANLWDVTARIAAWEGRVGAAATAWKKALSIARDEGIPHAACLTLVRLADMRISASRLDEAAEHLDEAEAVAIEWEDMSLRGRVWSARGSWYLHQAQLMAAADAWVDALAAFRESGEPDLEALTHLHLAALHSASGNPEAVRHLEEALVLLDTLDHHRALGLAYVRVADHALRQRKAEVALVAVEGARRFWGSRDLVGGLAPALRLGARALAALGEWRSATLVTAWLARKLGAVRPDLEALFASYRANAPRLWAAGLDDLPDDALEAQAVAAFRATAEGWFARLAIADGRLATAAGARALLEQLSSEVTAMVAVDDRALTQAEPMLLWQSAEAEHEVTPVPAGVLTLGRSPDNDVAIGWDEAVEPVHCMLRREGDAVFIRDAGTASGTFVDGEQLAEERKLEGGERLRIGRTELVYSLQAVPTTVATRGVLAGTPRAVARVAAPT